MKSNNVLMLALALSGAFALTACNRDATPAVEPAASAPAAEPAADPMPAPAPMPSAPMATAPMDSGMTFAAMDKNGDGGIALDELASTEMLHEHFSAADGDSDGKLSQAEVDKHRADMAATPGG
ncbi:MAG: EF-hand domain-containing protein [Lysobacter sp.]